MSEEEKPVKLQTVGFDARFPNVNQSKNCWQNYVDYFKCAEVKGEESPACEQFRKAYLALCPTKWTDTWDEQREEGVHPSFYVKKAAHH